jgi:serine/threonine protein phosphatase PrpC
LAVRLQLKLGAVTEQDQLPDSPDSILVVEPSVGSVARTKGNLYLLVTSRGSGGRAREATRMVADTIRNEYYYDESAGIRQCLTKVMGVANKRLAHQRDRYGLGHQGDGGGPIGVAVAVVRGRELYVATVGPAEAFLIRQARLSTLPDPNRDRGLPVDELEPEVWRGELSVGDLLCLVSENIVGRIGTDALKDALVTLHPQSAIEHLHARFVAADGKGSDGAVAFEATEVGATHKSRTLVPVRPAEPLAGVPDKSPIPLADTVTASAAAIGAGATRARSAAGNGFQRAIWRLQDLLPRRRPGSRRVTATSSRIEMQRRAAVALLAFIAVAGALVLGVYAVGGQRTPLEAIKSLTAAESAFDAAKAALDQVSGPGVDLIADDPRHALALLTTAYQQLDVAEKAGYPSAQVAPLRATALAGLDRLYGVTKVRTAPLYTFPASKPVQLAALVRGSDGAPYVLDTANKTVWRIDLARKTASAVLRSGQRTSTGRVADPRFIAIGGPDVVILDSKNSLWRWRPANNAGRGTLVRIPIKNSASWGNDIRDLATFVSNFDAAFYKLYVVDPSKQNIMVLDPANDGSGYPTPPTRRLPTDRPVDGITDLMIDGDIFVAENGQVERVIPATSWQPQLPSDTQLRPESNYTLLSSPILANGNPSKRIGSLYAFDAANHRIVAFNKADGTYVGQYMLVGNDDAWAHLNDFVVLPTADPAVPPTLWWISDNGINSALLQAAPEANPSASPGPSPSATPKPKPKPTKTPRH